jgi:hypothetical protein
MGSEPLARTLSCEAAMAWLVAYTQFAPEMLGFVRELTARGGEPYRASDWYQFSAVEGITTLRGFGMNRREVGVDR